MQKSLLGLSGILTFLLLSCSTAPHTLTEGKPAAWTLVFSQDSSLELEPCGCQFNPLGGLVRTENALATWRGESDGPLFFLVAGRTFTAEEETQRHLGSQAVLKAKYLAQGLKKLSVDALALSPEDLTIGETPIRELAEEAGVTLVSTNIKAIDGAGSLARESLTLEKRRGESIGPGRRRWSHPPERGQELPNHSRERRPKTVLFEPSNSR